MDVGATLIERSSGALCHSPLVMGYLLATQKFPLEKYPLGQEPTRGIACLEEEELATQ